MIWVETGLTHEGTTYYLQCKKCGNYPALNIENNNDVEGPYCNWHWHEHIDYWFDLLDKKLDNEDWGSSPETRRETIMGLCEMCCDVSYNRLKFLRYQGKGKRVCWDCYDKYSEK